jgi:hypothetical protein
MVAALVIVENSVDSVYRVLSVGVEGALVKQLRVVKLFLQDL